MARVKDNGHLEFIRTLPCLITGAHGVDACHIRYSDPRYGKINPGVGQKPSDWWVVPMTRVMHERQHSMGEKKFWENENIDPLPIAMALYLCGQNAALAKMILDSQKK